MDGRLEYGGMIARFKVISNAWFRAVVSIGAAMQNLWATAD